MAMFVRNKPKSQRRRKSLDSKLNVSQVRSRVMEFSVLSRGFLCFLCYKIQIWCAHLGLSSLPFLWCSEFKSWSNMLPIYFLFWNFDPAILKLQKDPFCFVFKVKKSENSKTQAILVQIYAGPWPQLSSKIIHLLA